MSISGPKGPVEDDEMPDDIGSDPPIDREWRLVLTRGAINLELSAGSELFGALSTSLGMPSRPRTTLKITGARPTTHDEALRTLTELGMALFFDIDLRYGISTQLVRQRPRRVRRRFEAMTAPPEFPTNNYPVQPLELYNYGRGAQAMPLLEFLAYYQVLEFFFPIFTRDDVIKRLRATLKDPRFNSNDDVEIGRLLTFLLPYGRATFGEREQLHTTLRACVDNAMIREFAEADDIRKEHFGGKQVIKGATTLSLADPHADLREQVARRLYDIRCRIVHAKQDGGGSGAEIIMPSGAEASALIHDIDLARFLAQQALIVGSNTIA